MPSLHTRLEQLEHLARFTRERVQPWIPPSREGVAARIAYFMPTYVAVDLHAGPVLDEAVIVDALAALPWPEPTHEPASLQGYRLLQAALRQCGVFTEVPA